MRNSLVLDNVMDDPMCVIVFQVEYVVNIPIQLSLMSTGKTKVCFF